MRCSIGRNARALSIAAVMVAMLQSGVLRAEESRLQECSQTFENAQKLRNEGKFRAASEALIACSQPTCPTFIAKECTSIYSDLQNSMPSITLKAIDGEGQVLTDVSVYLDGTLLKKGLDGRAVAVDPGLHELRFELEGRPSVTTKSLLAEGEKNKLITAVFPSPEGQRPPPPEPAPTPPVATSPVPDVKPGPPITPLVVGGIGVLALGAGIVLRLVADSDYRDMERTCRPNCSADRVDSLDQKYTISTVAMIAGGVGLATAGVLYFLQARPRVAAHAARFSLQPAAFGQGATATWKTEF